MLSLRTLWTPLDKVLTGSMEIALITILNNPFLCVMQRLHIGTARTFSFACRYLYWGFWSESFIGGSVLAPERVAILVETRALFSKHRPGVERLFLEDRLQGSTDYNEGSQTVLSFFFSPSSLPGLVGRTDGEPPTPSSPSFPNPAHLQQCRWWSSRTSHSVVFSPVVPGWRPAYFSVREHGQ